MDCKKYIDMDVHQATISIAVLDAAGKVVMDSVIETEARTFWSLSKGAGDFVGHLRGRHQRRLVIRPVETVCRQGGGLRSPQERATQSGQQE